MSRVALIMSLYKGDNLSFFIDSINSIFSQSYKRIDVFLCVDGVVPDAHLKFLNSLDSNKVTLITNDCNRGLAFSLNRLIDTVLRLKEYEYIARMDSDDISRPDRIKKQLDFLNLNSDIDVCGTSCREFGASFALEEKHLPITHQELLDFSITRCPFIHPSVMFRRRVFETGIRYPTDTALTEDMALWFELLVNGFKFANINEVLLDYRLNENTIKRRKGMDKALSEVKIRLYYMFKLKRISFKSILLIFSRFAFHLLPDSLMKYAYKNVR
ncbi:glycosyltransferase [Vibrio cholerae]|nr:glycosyltransferase [Vibrio cholerae]